MKSDLSWVIDLSGAAGNVESVIVCKYIMIVQIPAANIGEPRSKLVEREAKSETGVYRWNSWGG